MKKVIVREILILPTLLRKVELLKDMKIQTNLSF